METSFNKANRTFILPIGLSAVLIAAGIVGGISIHQNMRNRAVAAPSKLGDISNPAAAMDSKNQDLKMIIHEDQKKVVQLQIKFGTNEKLGSGFLFNDKGDILTNAHVVEGATEITVKMSDSTLYKGSVIGKSGDIDIALVRVPELAGTAPLKLAKDQKSEIGDEVIAFGSPLGLDNTVTTGIISGISRDFEIGSYKYKNMLQISAPISPGNSGGPLVDKKTGEVIGVNSAGIEGAQNIGFSIPIQQVLPLAVNWSANPSIDRTSSSSNSTSNSNGGTAQTVSTKSAEYLVRYFYENLGLNDYVTAYSLLGSDWHSKISYDTFRAGYINTLSVKIKDITSTQTANGANVTLIIEALEQMNGTKQLSQYKVDYLVGIENDKVKLLQGKAVKI